MTENGRRTVFQLIDPETEHATTYQFSSENSQCQCQEHEGGFNPYSMHALFCTVKSHEIYMNLFFHDRKSEAFITSSSPWKNFQDFSLQEFLIQLHKLGIIRIFQMHDGIKMMDLSVLVPYGFKATPLVPYLPPPTPTTTEEVVPALQPPAFPIIEDIPAPTNPTYQVDPTIAMDSPLSTIMTRVVKVPTSPPNGLGFCDDDEDDLENICSIFLNPDEREYELPDEYLHALPPSPEKRQRTPSFSSKKDKDLPSSNNDILFISVINGITVYNQERFPAPQTQIVTMQFDLVKKSFVYSQ